MATHPRRAAALIVTVLVAATGLIAGPSLAGEERLMAALGGRLTITRGSDLGTVCYEVISVSPWSPGGGDPMTSKWLGLYTDPPSEVTGLPTGTLIFAVDALPWDELQIRCVAGLDQAIVTDIFANPGSYFYTSTTCYELVGCSSTGVPLAPEGSACELLPRPAAEGGAISQVAHATFELRGQGFIPGTTAQLTFTPTSLALAPEQSGSPGLLTVVIDEYSRFSVLMAPRNEQAGRWTISVVGAGGCTDTLLLWVGAVALGTPFPDGLTPMPGVGAVLEAGGGDPGPAGGPALLPDTALPLP